MIDLIRAASKMLLMMLPFLLLTWACKASNFSYRERYRQYLMPILAFLFCLVNFFLMDWWYDLSLDLLELVPSWARTVAIWLGELMPDYQVELYTKAEKFAGWYQGLDLEYWAYYVMSALIMLGYLVFKSVVMPLIRLLFRWENSIFYGGSELFYECAEDQEWYLLPHYAQGRTLMKTLYISTVVLGVVGLYVSSRLYLHEEMNAPAIPVFGIIVVGELYFLLDGLTHWDMPNGLSGEEDQKFGNSDYSVMRRVLRKLFPDKLNAEDTTVSDSGAVQTLDELLTELEASEDSKEEIYGRFMRQKSTDGMELDRNYVASGRQLLNGESILFNNPFYYDLIPYIFYPMNRVMLRHKKVLIILGRHGSEEEITSWCRDGLTEVNNLPDLWRIGVLSEEPQDLDVGIVTRSSVHDLKLHEANGEFFDETEFVVFIEPSRLVTTAQVGLNSIVRRCRRKKKQIVFCSADKNCDGLVDSLSHIVMSSIREVSATNHHKGASSYMIWDADDEHLQHRMLPNLSRYLGGGTELSFAALKNQIPVTTWYGGDAFPVVDAHWIAKQYYYDLLKYANLPTEQETLDRVFRVGVDMWSTPKRKNQYITVEDESFNMFEVKREFSTRAANQGFVNVLCSEYLLKDYMAGNNSIFNADPKAIPYITADYARTLRNVVLRLCLRMSAAPVAEEEIGRELMLIDRAAENPAEELWRAICETCSDVMQVSEGPSPELRCKTTAGNLVFGKEVLVPKRRFSLDSGAMELVYTITDSRFVRIVLGGLQPAQYVAEDENGQRQYLGTELSGHVYQKYLPGQFFTFNGKYYEMLRVTAESQVLVRRASDHIDGRPGYRQERWYYLSAAKDSTVMGECRDMGVMRLIRQFADVRVETPGYYAMRRYNDFETARRVGINGVPDRMYSRKAMLRIDFNSEVGPETISTLTLLINEVLRSLLAENQDYLTALTPGEAQVPLTCSLFGENGFEPLPGSIYIIEDSQLDLGLLDAVERNLNRIFAIVCDYLQWHKQALYDSLNPPPPRPEPEAPIPVAEKPKEGFFRRLWNKLKSWWKAFVNWLKKLFHIKPKDAQEPPENPEGIPVAEAPEAPEAAPEAAEEPQAEPEAEEVSDDTQEAAPEVPQEEVSEAPQEEAPEEAAEEPSEEEPVPAGEADGEEETLNSLYDLTPGEAPAEEQEEPCEEGESDTAQGQPADSEPADTVEYEHEKVRKPGFGIQRKPYHQRYFLLYGGTELPQNLDLEGVLSLLTDLGYDNSSLTQARKGQDVAAMIERSFVPNQAGVRYCDFCGCQLSGVDYEVLGDGRERCTNCSRTAVKSLNEFVAIHDSVVRNMRSFFGIRINAPVRIQMVNAKKLHRHLGHTFVPTGNSDGRILGVAIRDRHGYSILLENGSPRIMATMTLVHEMTHIWQYLNWNEKEILNRYGKEQNLEMYEGMAKWVEIQYAYLINEIEAGKREEIITRNRDDEYGRGFRMYEAKYPLTIGLLTGSGTPFDDPKNPL